MPPRKRRQSNQGDENANDRQTCGPTVSNESDKLVIRGQQKGTEGSLAPTERRLTARQQSKQDALESAAATASSGSVITESGKKTATRQTTEPTRFSTRIVKRPRRDLSPTESPAKKAAKKAPVPEPITTPETKAKRHWELWSCEDKDSFFEGLCEYGKDFDAIHNLIVSKCKRRGGSQPITVKNKEQVRHFYYRTWHKISKQIEPVEDLKKDIQELYGLISFGVLRKKMRGGINPNDKNWQKLNELVHFGATTIKVKGKKLRIKTPVCPALKKLNNIEEPRREPGPKIPEKIRIEFRPKTNSAWSQVQEQAQNPRLRMTVRPDRCLSSLVRFLEQKWRPHRLKLKENLNEEEIVPKEFRVYPHRDSTLQCVNLEAVDDPVLHFSLKTHKDATQTSPTSNKGKRPKPKSTTPVPELSEPKESVISDLNSCACDTHCAETSKSDSSKGQSSSDSKSCSSCSKDTSKPDSSKGQSSSDSKSCSSCSKDTSKPDSSKGLSFSDSSKSASTYSKETSKPASSKEQSCCDASKSCSTCSKETSKPDSSKGQSCCNSSKSCSVCSKDTVKPDINKGQASSDSSKSVATCSKEQSFSNSSKLVSCKELFCSNSSKVSSGKEQTESSNPSLSKEQSSLDCTKDVGCREQSCDDSSKEDSGKELLLCKEQSCVASSVSSSFKEQPCDEIDMSCVEEEQDVAKSCGQSSFCDSQKPSEGSNDLCDCESKHLFKNASNDSKNSDCCENNLTCSLECKDLESWQSMCSSKTTCKQCSNDSSVPFSPACDKIKSSESSELVSSITLFGSSKGVTLEAAETGTSIENTRRYSVPELRAIVDDENAMFPDVPLESYRENAEMDDGEISTKVETKTESQEIEIVDALEDPASPSKLLLSPNSEDCLTTDSGESSQSEIARVCRDIMDKGWNLADAENVKMAELYLMFGKGGEIRFEYDWCSLQANELHERLLSNLNNMLRRLANLATVEFTDFTKAPSAGSPCHMCGTVLGGKQGKGKEKGQGRSPPVKARTNKCSRDMATQTNVSPVLIKKEPSNLGPASTVSASPDGVFRVPVASPAIHHQKSITTLTDKELIQHLNPGINKQLMRPRKLKSVSRKPVMQRTILPKSNQPPGQMVTFYPVVANSPVPSPGSSDKPTSGMGQTIVGHPVGIQTQPGNKVSGVSQTIVGHPIGIQTRTVPISMVPTATPSQQLQTTTIQYVGSVGSPTVSSTTMTGVELSLSPAEGDQTLMRIPESQIGSMSQEALKAAGLTTVPISTMTGTPPTCKSTQKGSISPPNLSSLLDMSFSGIQPGGEGDKFMELNITDNTFTGLLEDNKPLSVDPGLTTPPIRSQSDQHLSPLHSPPVRSLFKMNSPIPDQQWLNGEVTDISLTSFLETPGKPASSVGDAQTTSTFNSQPLTLFGDCSRDSQSNRIDVDSTLQCMMNESSIDYVRKFADLAEQIAQGDAIPTQTKPDIINSHTVKELT